MSHHTFTAPELDDDGQRYRAECSCGWVSDLSHTTRTDAGAEADAHAEHRSAAGSPDTADILAAGRHRLTERQLRRSGKPLLALSPAHWQTVLDALWDASQRYWDEHEDPYDHEQRRLQEAYADLVRQLS